MDTEDPGSVRLHVQAREEIGEKQEWKERVDSISVPLSDIRDAFGGDVGELLDDFGRAHPVSLAPWADRDPAPRLVFSFSYQQRDAPLGLHATTYEPDPLSRLP